MITRVQKAIELSLRKEAIEGQLVELLQSMTPEQQRTWRAWLERRAALIAGGAEAPPDPEPCPCVVVRCRWTGDRLSEPGEPGEWRAQRVTVCDRHQSALNDVLEAVAARMRSLRSGGGSTGGSTAT